MEVVFLTPNKVESLILTPLLFAQASFGLFIKKSQLSLRNDNWLPFTGPLALRR